MTLELSLSCYNNDITRPLMEGAVSPQGIDLSTTVEYPPRRHRRFLRHGEFDICEVSLASYVSALSQPEEYPVTAIPVYPEKKFRHSFLYKHADADVEDPSDLAGKRVGIQSWQTTANVWIRGIAQEHYGLDLESVTWFRRKEDDVARPVPDRFDVRPVPGTQGADAVSEPRDLREMLLAGDLDAAMDPASGMFQAVVDSEEAELFFENPLAEEQRYFEKTGIHPPMHVVAIRDEVLDEHPWVAVNVFDAFCEARDACLDRHGPLGATTTLTWSHLHRLEQDRVLGADAWEYGLTEKTRRELRTFLEYAADQGIAPHVHDVEELFFEPTLDL